jgi:hypothetical protein
MECKARTHMEILKENKFYRYMMMLINNSSRDVQKCKKKRVVTHKFCNLNRLEARLI